MKVVKTEIPEVLIVEPAVHRDGRGFFFESYHKRKLEDYGLRDVFVQDNHSRSVRGTLRGLHAQRRHPQAKLVRAVSGEIFDVAADVRKGSPTYGRWVGVALSAENFRQLYVPAGFVHGFCVVSETAEVEYKCTDFYEPTDEYAVAFDDPTLAIHWPVKEPLLSDKDKAGKRLSEIEHLLPFYKQGR